MGVFHSAWRGEGSIFSIRVPTFRDTWSRVLSLEGTTLVLKRYFTCPSTLSKNRSHITPLFCFRGFECAIIGPWSEIHHGLRGVSANPTHWAWGVTSFQKRNRGFGCFECTISRHRPKLTMGAVRFIRKPRPSWVTGCQPH